MTTTTTPSPASTTAPRTPGSAAARVTITWDDLNRPEVDARLQQQQAISTAKQHFEQDQIPSAAARTRRFTWWYNTLVHMAAFGALGGLLGWGFGIVLHLRPDAKLDARNLIANYQQIERDAAAGNWSAQERDHALRVLRAEGRTNPYFAIYLDDTLTDGQRDAKRRDVAARDAWRDFLANVLFYAVSGMMIAALLSAAESLVERRWSAAITNGSIGAGLGVAGGVVVSLFVEQIYYAIVGTAGASIDQNPGVLRELIARGVEWGVLGLFLSVAPGVVLRSNKRLLIGAAGGVLGGIAGGLLFVPATIFAQSDFVAQSVNVTNPQLFGRLVGIVTIGLVAGLSTGMIEHVVKTGWLRVSEGLIAGKQFVLYRNPTYIGSAPWCHIYLFKDPQVGRRHAAVHVVPGGFELEDLPLGGRTLVNGRPAGRVRLKHGDRVKVGATMLTFQERVRGDG